MHQPHPTATRGYRSLRTMCFSDIIRLYGGRCVISPEAKTTAGATILLGMVQRTGLQASSLVQHFTLSSLNQFTAAGIPALWLSQNGTNQTAAQVAAAGVQYVCFDASATSDATISAWVADGRFKVGVYTIGRHWQFDKYAALGCVFYFSNSPVYNSKQTALYRTTTDMFGDGNYFHGHHSYNDGSIERISRGYFETGGWLTFGPVTVTGGGFDRNVLLGYMNPLVSPTSYTLDFDMRMGTLPTDLTRFGLPRSRARMTSRSRLRRRTRNTPSCCARTAPLRSTTATAAEL